MADFAILRTLRAAVADSPCCPSAPMRFLGGYCPSALDPKRLTTSISGRSISRGAQTFAVTSSVSPMRGGFFQAWRPASRCFVPVRRAGKTPEGDGKACGCAGLLQPGSWHPVLAVKVCARHGRTGHLRRLRSLTAALRHALDGAGPACPQRSTRRARCFRYSVSHRCALRNHTPHPDRSCASVHLSRPWLDRRCAMTAHAWPISSRLGCSACRT